MTMSDFQIEVRKEINNYLELNGIGGIEVKFEEVVKTNDNVMHGFAFIRSGTNTGATVYIDDLFERHIHGASIEDLRDDITRMCDIGVFSPLPPGTDILCGELEDIKDQLMVRLIDVNLNMSYMAERPYIDVGCGLALIACINGSGGVISEWKVSVNNGLLNSFGCGVEELLTEAMRNTMIIAPPVLLRPEDVLRFKYGNTGVSSINLLESCSSSADTLMVLTNSYGYMGAAALFYPEVMERISGVTGGSYYAIPSSVHEMMILPYREELDPDDLKRLLLDGNRSVTDESDRLSENVFCYDSSAGKLYIAA